MVKFRKKKRVWRKKKKNFTYAYLAIIVGITISMVAAMTWAAFSDSDKISDKAIEHKEPIAAHIESDTTFNCSCCSKEPRHIFHPYRDGPDVKHDGDVYACEGCYYIRQKRREKK